MAPKNKSKTNSAIYATSVQGQADETPARSAAGDGEIRHRAYEIYLERGGLPGDELDDWLRAEREL